MTDHNQSSLRSHAPRLASVATSLPEHRYEQSETTAALVEMWDGDGVDPLRVEYFHDAVGVEGRHFALPLSQYGELNDFETGNDLFIEHATKLGGEALERALEEAGVAPESLDALFFTTVTGVSTPSVDAKLVNELGLNSRIRRTPMFGLGCSAGAAGVARMADYLRAYPEHSAALVSVELCSLTFQRDDLSPVNLIATGLFGDGASAVVGVGAEHQRVGELDRETSPAIVDNRSAFYEETEYVMGWEIGNTGFKLVLSEDLPEHIHEQLPGEAGAFLDEHNLKKEEVASWVCHPGGPSVLEAIEEALELPRDEVELSWRSMAEVGNLSSSSVLFVLEETIEQKEHEPGDRSVMMAMGPGFSSEMLMLEW